MYRLTSSIHNDTVARILFLCKAESKKKKGLQKIVPKVFCADTTTIHLFFTKNRKDVCRAARALR